MKKPLLKKELNTHLITIFFPARTFFKFKIVAISIFSLLLTIHAFGQQKNAVQFTHLTTLNGLSQSTVSCILKDKYGFMWFGTQNGLNKYDGYRFKIYRHNIKDPGSIPSNNIKCLYEDHAGNLWIGTTGGGLILYDRSKDSFSSVGYKGNKDELLSDNAITTIFEDKKGNFWVGTFANLNLLDRKTGKITQFKPDPSRQGSLSNQTITCVYEDNRNNLWVGTDNGLNLLDTKTRRFRKFFHDHKDDGSISSDQITVISQDAAGRLWVGSIGGLNLFDYSSAQFRSYEHDSSNPGSLINNVVHGLSHDLDNNLWIGTEGGLDLLNVKTGVFTHFQKNPKDERSLSHSSIYSLLFDDQGILWAGTFAGGVNKYDRNQNNFNLYRNFANEITNANVVTSFAETLDGDIWIGTDGGGLYLWQRKWQNFLSFNSFVKTKAFPSSSILTMKLNRRKDYLWLGTYDKGLIGVNLKTYDIAIYQADKILNNSVYAILEDTEGSIWIGTNGGGLSVLNPANEKIKNYKHKSGWETLSNDFIRSLYEDTTGNIWIGTHSGGISVLNPKTDHFVFYNSYNTNLGSEVIYSIFGDSKNNIWIGTLDAGLHLFNPKTKQFTIFSESEGLASNSVNSIVEDRSGYLWISADRGLSRFNPKTKSFKTYTVLNGLQSNEFSLNAGLLTSNGELLFGGLDGFNAFDPASIKDNNRKPPVVITDFQLFNKSVPVANNNSPLKLNINETREIILSYNQSVFTIEFAALSYTVPEKNKYAYMLEGFDEDWNYAGQERKATYTNLDPGEYVFKVKAANNDGVWNEQGTSINIRITPPFWKTNLAYFLYILSFSGILYAIYLEVRSREKLKSEVVYQKITADKIQELNQLKINFFTNISHELRTPLSLIIDPIRKIMQEDISMEQAKKYSGLVFNNASRLMSLVNQLLDFRKLETGNLQLEARKTDIISIIKNVAETFTVRATERNIDFKLNFHTDYLEAWVDEEKLDKIFINLIANAFKYTPDFGTIAISTLSKGIEEVAEPSKKVIEIHVKDSGAGVPPEFTDKIFDVFYQVKGVRRFEKESSGIGLALTKELVLLHNGRVYVESTEGEGADFVLIIPIGEENFNNDNSALPIYQKQVAAIKEVKNDLIRDKQPEELAADLPIILIVEDNQDLREYVAQELESTYKVEQAADGLEGFDKAIKLIPDLIISDINMPGSDGIELCNKVKSDVRTSHIPLILLTAKQTEENKIEGYTSGADDYISKPFNTVLLAVRVKNLLDSRKKLRELYANQKTDHASNNHSLAEIDVEFLKKAASLIEENLSDTSFDIDLLAENLLMSRRQLYRKLSALTNQTAHDFMTNIRLEKAAAYLLSGNYSISEIAYKVGFSEPANFSRSFTKMFGLSPKKYLSENKPIKSK